MLLMFKDCNCANCMCVHMRMCLCVRACVCVRGGTVEVERGRGVVDKVLVS